MVKVIAEIGINHKGSTEVGKQLIDQAVESNCWGVKFQYRKIDTFYKDSLEIGDGILVEELTRIDISINEYLTLINYAKEKNIKVGISFFRVEDFLDFEPYANMFDFFKVPSSECTNTILIDKMLETNKTVIVSTGGHSQYDIEQSLLPYKDKVVILHCVSNYPVRLGHQNLNFINTLKDIGFENVGYSSHDSDIEICLMAMCFGIKWLERHITLDKNGDGLDDSTSSEVRDFIKIDNFIQNLEGIIETNSVNQGEILNIQNLSTGLYATRDIPKGEIPSLNDFEIKAPRKGLGVGEFIQKKNISLKQNVNKEEALTGNHFQSNTKLEGIPFESVIDKKVGIPVRLHDYMFFKNNIPVNLYEFHLSYQELLSDNLFDIVNEIENQKSFSIHLPDYLPGNKLVDPVSDEKEIRHLSQTLINTTRNMADSLENRTGKKVPIVGSFSMTGNDKFGYYDKLFNYIHDFKILPQWLPCYAWYFGGSEKINAFNSYEDIEYINKNNIDICLDICHLILSANYYKEDFTEWYKKLIPNTKHIHIADAEGVDSEGLEISDDRLNFFKKSLDINCYKILEVWQGHLNNGEKFKTELIRLFK